MAQGIVDVFETIQIQKEDSDIFFLAMSQGDRLRNPIVEHQAIGQIRKTIVLGGVRHLEREVARGSDVVEYDHRSGDAAGAVVDRGGGIFNSEFNSVAAAVDAIRR